MNPSTINPQAIIFDLDDTLYDHLFSARHGLMQLSQRYPAMGDVTTRELEDRYSEALESIHLRLLRGEVTQDEARTIRMQQLFRSFSIEVDDKTAFAEYKQFRQDYDSVCQVVTGTIELLDELKTFGLRLAVMTNNLVSEQIPKLRQLSLTPYFDVVAISEEVGASKPSPKIFEVTLQRLGLDVDDVVMVGDSLTSDIAGATTFGMRCVWLDRRPDLERARPSGVDVIESDFSNLNEAIAKILSR